jgi:hypothetical protein
VGRPAPRHPICDKGRATVDATLVSKMILGTILEPEAQKMAAKTVWRPNLRLQLPGRNRTRAAEGPGGPRVRGNEPARDDPGHLRRSSGCRQPGYGERSAYCENPALRKLRGRSERAGALHCPCRWARMLVFTRATPNINESDVTGKCGVRGKSQKCCNRWETRTAPNALASLCCPPGHLPERCRGASPITASPVIAQSPPRPPQLPSEK